MAGWNTGDQLLEIVEHQKITAADELVRRFPPAMWDALGLSISQRLGTEAETWEVTADRYVGVAQLRAGVDRAQLRILPKVDADIFFMADYAFGAERDLLADRELIATLDAVRPDPAACMLAWYLAELDTFVRRWLRRDYVLRHEVFDGKVRGRFLVGEYVQRFLGQGMANKAPCQLFDLTPDNLPNQILKATLRRVARLSVQVPLPEAKRALQRRVDLLLPSFAHISDRTILSSDYNRLRLRGALRHYRPMIEKSRAMLEGMYLTEDLGPNVQDAFLWDMSVLYEEALRGVLTGWAEGRIDKKRAKARIVDPSGTQLSTSAVKPDYVMVTDDGRLVLDAKYKNTGGKPSEEDAEIDIARTKIRLGRNDIYQVVSYGRHERFAPATPALIYPVALKEDESLPSAHTVQGFQQDVLVLFLDIGPHARANLPEFYARLNAAAAPSGASADDALLVPAA
jgi:5-methylcytosine-specific restriction enzyme subunit McrC